MAKIAALFPGQGSQSVGMGQDWFNKSNEAKKIFALADEVLNFPLSKLCFEGPIEELTLTANTQPALLTVSYISFMLSDISVDVAAGHSLGEFSALVAAGVLSFEDALVLVRKRGQYMQSAVPAGTGSMIAVMGSSEDDIRSLISEINTGVVEIANLNCPGQTVLAGEKEAVQKFSEALSAKGGKSILLNVSAPFHCSMMKPVEDLLSPDLDKTTFNDPKFPVYANYTASKISTGLAARELLKKQICGTVRWTEQVENLVKENDITKVLEFGPGGVLSKLVKRINSGLERLEVFDCTSLETTKNKLEK